MRRALLCLDLVNDYLHTDGKLAAGYADYVRENDVIARISNIQDQFRQQGALVVHARTQFSSSYVELNKKSAIYAPIFKAGALQMQTWGTEFYAGLGPVDGEPCLTKHRLSPFYRTRLELILQTQEIKELYICGVSTDLAVPSTAREAHDRDFETYVLTDACVARASDIHQNIVDVLPPVAHVGPFSEFAIKLTQD